MALQTKTITANGSKGHHKFTLTVIEDGISTPNNYSIIRWSLSLSPIKTGYDWSYKNTVPVSYSITIDGENFTGNIMTYDGSSTVTVKSGEKNITHNADGNKTISYSFSVSSLNQSYLTGSASNSGSMDLTSIPRAARIVDADNFFDEFNPYIYYSNPAGNSVASLQACISLDGTKDDIKYRDIPKVGDTYQFILTDSERTILRNAALNGHDTITVSFHVKTVIGTETYYSSLRRYMTVVNAKPTMDPVVEDIDEKTLALTGNKDVFIKGYSDAQMVVNAKAYKGASIVYQKLEVDGKSSVNEGINANEAAVYPNVITPTFKFTARDNRGLEVVKPITKTVINYVPLTCNQLLDIQLDGETTAKVTLTMSGNYFNGSFGKVNNSLKLWVRRTNDEGTWGGWQQFNGTISGNSYTFSTTFTGLAYDKSYTFQSCAEDALGEVYTNEYPIRLIPVFDWGENDFNFNVPIKYKGKDLGYITEEGTKNGWFYRKWSSGKGECWKILEINTAVNTAWGSWFVGNTTMARQNYPFPFKSKPVEIANLLAGSYAGVLYAVESGNGVNGAYASAIYNVCRPTAAANSLQYYINLYAYGDL